MKNKKTLYIVLAVVALCLIGLLTMRFFNWPANFDETGGNIAKSFRFSRKTAADGLSNMQELLLNDESFRDGVLLSYVVMSTRADEFNALVEMSEEAAGEIPAFKDVLKDMGKAKKMVANVIATMGAAGDDLNAALGGEAPKELAQNTTNAALAYNTMQKQNVLANRFIDTTDDYLKTNEADDRLKFVRDEWVDYQKLTAAIDNDEEASAKLEEKGYLLTTEQAAAALGASENGAFFFHTGPLLLAASDLSEVLGLETSLSSIWRFFVFNKDNAFFNQENAFFNKDNAFFNQENGAFFNKDNAFFNKENGAFFNQENGQFFESEKLANSDAQFAYVNLRSLPSMGRIPLLREAVNDMLSDVFVIHWEPPLHQTISGTLDALATGNEAKLQGFYEFF